MMDRWIPVPWNLAQSRDPIRLSGWCWCWTQTHEGKPITRRDVQDVTGYGWRKAAKLLDEVQRGYQEWMGQHRAKSGPKVGQQNDEISTTCKPKRAKSGPKEGQDRAESVTLRPSLQDTNTNTNLNIDKVKKTWMKLMEISEGSTTASHKLKLTAWRRSMLGERLTDYSQEAIINAWRWWNESTDEHADFLRQNRGRAGIDTFLRRSNHDKYQAFAEDWQCTMEEPGPDASIDEMRAWINYKNRQWAK